MADPIRHWRCGECGGLASTSAHADVCECWPCGGREMGVFDLVVLEAERDRYRQIGDHMQSEASRLAEFVREEFPATRKDLTLPYEVHQALIGVEGAIRDWTAARSATNQENADG